MNKQVKTLSLFGILAVLGFSLTSCVKTGGGGGDKPDPEPEEVDITLDSDYQCEISLLIPGSNANETTMIDALIKEFNMDYPNITFSKNFVSTTNYENTVRNQWLSGTLPDIVWSNSPDFYSLVGNEIPLKLNPYIDAAEKEGTFNFKDDFLTEYFDMGAVDGNYYCFPRSCDSVVVFYNKKLLQTAGIDLSVVQNGWTMDQFNEVMRQYRTYLDGTPNKDTYYCLDANLTNWLSVCYPILRSFGGEVVNSNKEVLLDSNETREALNFARDWMEKGYIVPDGTTPGNSFEIGTAPFLFQSSSISLFAERRELKGNIDIVSFPLIQDHNTPKIGSGIAGYCINSKTKEKVACWKFLEKMLSKEGQNAMADGGLHLPSIRKDLQDYTNTEVKWGGEYTTYNLSAYTYGGEYKITADYLGLLDVKYKAKLDDGVRGMFADAIRKDKSVDQAISTAVKYLKNALKN